MAAWIVFHVDEAIHIPLPILPQRVTSYQNRAAGGYLRRREPEFYPASLLQVNGFQHLQNIVGGVAAYREAERVAWHPADLVLPGEEI